MLRSGTDLEGFAIGARDGEIGKVYSLWFDDRSWVIRYLVADTGSWLPGRKVLIAATALHRPDWKVRVFPTDLTKEQVVNSPEVDTDKPVSRGREEDLHRHYHWVPYWGATHEVPIVPAGHVEAERPGVAVETAETGTHLRSTREVKGCRIHATDGLIGRVVDFIISDENWVIRYLAVHTGRWRPGRSVLISPEWVREIDWEQRKVWVDVSRQTIADSPPYDPSAPVNREYEVQMYDYYGRPRYWT